eukprot:c25419_g2_i1 orf=215-400(-)
MELCFSIFQLCWYECAKVAYSELQSTRTSRHFRLWERALFPLISPYKYSTSQASAEEAPHT